MVLVPFACCLPLFASLSILGKTTLLDVLAERKTVGEVKGSIYANGSAIDPKVYRRITVSISLGRQHISLALQQ